MTQKKISTHGLDNISHAVNSLSKVVETVNAVSNAMMDTRFAGYTQTMNGEVPSSSLIGGCPTFTVSSSSLPYSGGSSYQLNIQDTGKYPVVDIVNDFITDKAEDVNVSAYRVDIYAAGVPKENISVHLEEGNFVGTTFYPPKMNIRISKNEMKEQTGESFVYKESKHSYTNRIISLPEDADVFNTSEAILEHGVLTFKVRKNTTPKTPTKLVTINIK